MMNTGVSIFAGMALIVLIGIGAVVTNIIPISDKGTSGEGRYMGVTASTSAGIVWVVDTQTGAARLCHVKGIDNMPAQCREWLN